MSRMPEDCRAMAERHVITGRRTVARQREIIARLKSLGRDTHESERLLDTFERSLAIFEDDLRRISQDA
jgi:hypothetical protein